MSMDDFSSGDLKAATDAPGLDEDLFDFPALEAASPAKAQPTAAPEPEPEPLPVTRGGYTGIDPDLDLDLFGFPALEGNAPEQDPHAAGLEGDIENATQAVNDLLDDDLGEMVQDHHQDQLRREHQEQAARRSPQAPQAHPAQTPFAQAPDGSRAAARLGRGATPAVQWALVGVLIVFMLGSLALFGNFTSSFSNSVDGLRSDVAANSQAGRSQSNAQQQRIDQLEARIKEMSLAGAAGTGAFPGSGMARVVSPAQPKTRSEVTLMAAQSLLDAADFVGARRMLFRDLALAGSIPQSEREVALQSMELLVARSFLLEARHLEEKAR